MPPTLENDAVQIDYDAPTGRFSLTEAGYGRAFVVGGSIPGVVGDARRVRADHPRFGRGQALEISAAAGVARLMLFPKLPFVLVQRSWTNGAAEPVVYNRLPVAELPLELGKPAAALKTLGTGGLSAPGANSGSYGWLAVADPTTGGGAVAGWVTHERASGVLFPHSADDAVHIQARADYGRLRILPGATADSEMLAIGYFSDIRIGLEAWADVTAKALSIHLPAHPAGFCTWYADKHGGSSDEKNLLTLSQFAAKELKPDGFDFVQIDDGWQRGDSKGNGPHKDFTAFNPNGPYPSGMKAMADGLKAFGLRPGIWFMPFAGTYNDPFFAEHQDWFVKRADGAPYDTAWGGTSLDMTHPGAQEHLREVVARIGGEWGYTYFKMDGLYTGLAAKQVYVNSGFKEDDLGDAVFADPSKTNLEAFRDGLRLVRETAGPDVFFLGCTAAQNMRSYTGAFGLVDAMRTGADNNGSWHGWAHESPVSGSRNYHLNGRIWYNDPDPEYVRTGLTLEEAQTVATWPAIAGQLNSNSDWLPDLPPERIDILRRTLRPHGRLARPVDLLENDPPRLWTVSDTDAFPRRDIVAAFNWSDQTATINEPIGRFGLPKAAEYAAFSFWDDTLLPPVSNLLQLTLPPHGCAVVSIRPMLTRPFPISTLAHVTQGMLDLSDERWDARRSTLSAIGSVIPGQRYEIRVYAPVVKGFRWRAIDARIGRRADRQPEVTQSGSLVRLHLTVESGADVRWSIHFALERAA